VILTYVANAASNFAKK